MNYPPNVDGAVWLAKEIWPRVRRSRPDARLELVGSHPAAAVRSLADAAAGVTVTGSVPDVRPYLWRAAVAAAPLRTARGVQNKVLEAVAAGLPIVTTPVVIDGLPAAVRTACASADSAGQFADHLVSALAKSPEGRRAEALAADIASLSWPQCLRELRPILTTAAATRPAAAART
jgi:glycosyltransferase involved in cell wall biosynthesis